MAEKDPDKKEELEEKAEKEQPAERPEKDHPKEHLEKDALASELARERPHYFTGYYNELNRVISVLFVGVLALMTFLLTVGLQRPHGMFKNALYTAVVLLPLNLLAYVFGHLFAAQAEEAKFAADGDAAKVVSARKRLRVIRFIQQVLFMLAVLAVAWVAFSAAQFFFNLPANPMGGGGAPQ